MSELNKSSTPKQSSDKSLNPDAELIARCQAEEEQAFRELVENYRLRVASIAYQVLGNYQDAQDVSQIVFAKLHGAIGQFNPRMKFYTWLYRLTVNAAIDFQRSNKRHTRMDSIDDNPEHFHESHHLGVDALTLEFEKGELQQLLKKLTVKLNQNQSIAFELCDLQGFTFDEASDILDVKKTTLRWHLHMARKQIRDKIRTSYPEYWRG